ncbi:LysR substrate-binding domain-containing protein [Rhodococcus sp. NPDC059968]|uniref:LysR substrate-binding domain-containing protein n=1 Tax=Rhodococcus sp. NPDC059968 TaxID=3347017 RepID=UPI00366AD3E6
MSDRSYHPTLAQLRAFAAVAEYRHFGYAAAHLGVSQPTLSQGLAALEAGLGVRLIERSTRRVIVTGAGMRLLPMAVKTLECANMFVAAASDEEDQWFEPIRIGLIPTVAPYLLPAMLPALRKRFPGLRLVVIEDQRAGLLEALRAGILDVAVLALQSVAYSGAVEIELYSEDLILIVPQGDPIAGERGLPLSALRDLTLLLLEEGSCLRDHTLDLCRSIGAFPPSGDSRFSSLATIVQCVVGGHGAALVPESVAEIETEGAAVAAARFSSPAPSRTVGLVYRSSSSRSEHYRQLAEALAETRPRASAIQHTVN